MARLSAAPGLLRSASRSKRAKVTFPYLRNSHNKCGCYHFLDEEFIPIAEASMLENLII